MHRGEAIPRGPRSAAVVTLMASTVAIALQCLRVLFPVAYSYRERAGLTSTALILVLAFGAAAVAPVVLAVAGPRRTIFGAVIALAVMRVVLQAGEVRIETAAVASGVAVFALACVAVGLVGRPTELALGVVAGLLLDTLVRSAWSTFDIAWQDGVWPWMTTIALVGLLVGGAWWSARGAARPTGAAFLVGVAVGPYLFLELLFLQSPAFVASSGHTSIATAVGLVVIGDALALAVTVLALRDRLGLFVVAAGVAALTLGSWALTGVTGALVLVLVVAVQVLATAAFALTFLGPGGARPVQRDAVGWGVGSMLLGLLVFGYQLHYDHPLPVSNRWLAVAASLILGVGAMWCAAHRVEPTVPARLVARTTSTLVMAAIGIALVVAASLAVSAPDTSPSVTRPRQLRVMTYNVHEAITTDGRLDPRAFARTVEGLRPDVLVVEEAGRGWPISSTIDLAEWSKRVLGMPYVWGPSANDQLGNLLFSRVPIRHARVISLPQGTGTTRRSAIVATVAPVDGRPVTVVGTHLQNGEGAGAEATRIAEIHRLVRAIDGREHVVLAGDLNVDPGSPEMRALLGAGLETTQPTRRCALKTSNDNCVDWILVTSDMDQSEVHVPAIDTYDHRPLVTVVSPR